MADECSFYAEWCSTATIQDKVILAHSVCKEMNLCLIRAFLEEKPSFFLTDLPSNQICLSSHYYPMKKLLVLRVGPLFLKNRSDMARKVVHSSPCCVFHTSL